jgi:amidase
MNDIASLSATRLVEALKNKQMGSLELLEFYIERYERLNPRVNAIVATNFESARKRAKEADTALARGEVWGPLHGLPMTIKDGIPVVGMPYTRGMPIARDFVPTANADVVELLLDAGAIIFGKTNLPFRGRDCQTFNDVYGQTNNPWDVTRTPGGSSGGSAAALAAGLTGLEIGRDIGGSIRLPAHFCGVYGHKPSFNIVSMKGGSEPFGLMDPNYYHTDYYPPLDMAVTGPLARSSADLRLAMDIIVGPPSYERKAITIKLPPPRKTNLREFKVGLWIDDQSFPPDTAVGDCLQNMADRLAKAGANLKTEKPNFIDLGLSYRARDVLSNMNTSHTYPQEDFDRAKGQLGTLKDEDQSYEAMLARDITAGVRDWNILNNMRAVARQWWEDYFQNFDVLLCPVVRIAAHHHDNTAEPSKRVIQFNGQELDYLDVILPWNSLSLVSYLPATVAPIGFTPEDLPVGVQIIGPYLEDNTPIQFAMLIEEHLTGSFKVPPGFE